MISESEVESLQLSVLMLLFLPRFTGVTAFFVFTERGAFALLFFFPADRVAIFLGLAKFESLTVVWEALAFLLVRMHPDTLYLLEFIFMTIASNRVPLPERIGSFFSFKVLCSAFAFPFM